MVPLYRLLLETTAVALPRRFSNTYVAKQKHTGKFAVACLLCCGTSVATEPLRPRNKKYAVRIAAIAAIVTTDNTAEVSETPRNAAPTIEMLCSTMHQTKMLFSAVGAKCRCPDTCHSLFGLLTRTGQTSWAPWPSCCLLN